MAISATNTGVAITRSQDTEAGVVHASRVTVQREIRKTVTVGGNIFAQANFYINTSRLYVGKRKLTRYVYIPYLHYVCFVMFFLSLISLLHHSFAFIMCCLNFLFFLFYLQNMYVNVTTMRYVLLQPSVPNNSINTANAFFKIKFEEFAAVYAVSQEAGLGAIAHESEKVTIQVFKDKTKSVLKKCVYISTLCFFGSLVMFNYTLIFGLWRMHS